VESASRGGQRLTSFRFAERHNTEVFTMDASLETGKNVPSGTVKCCDRCARRAFTLFFDDLTLQDLCEECCDWLKRRRSTTSFFAITKKI
jgi:hypothetical protein